MTGPYSYTAYGLCLSSCIELPNFSPTEKSNSPDICVEFGADCLDFSEFEHVFELSYLTAPLIESVNLEPVDADLHKVAYRITYWGGVQFVVFDSGAQIRMSYPATSNFEDVAAILAGPVLGFAMRLFGVFCIHASVVAMDGHALALVAPSGGGKSTTAAALAARGHTVVSDDVLVLRIERDSVMVQPGFPWLRLCNDSFNVLTEHGPHLVTKLQGEKQFAPLPQRGYRFTLDPLPLVALYTMNSITERESITAIPGSVALVGLLGHTYPSLFYRLHKSHRANELTQAKHVLQKVAARGINYPRRLDRLTELCELLERDMREQILSRSQQRHNAFTSPAT
ncbi:MAG: hypothetical protein KA135_02620 [Halioglobus sp.]|nr:hypothetical protein [Halioglobus sp.]